MRSYEEKYNNKKRGGRTHFTVFHGKIIRNMWYLKTSTLNTMGASPLQDKVIMSKGLTLNPLSHGLPWAEMGRKFCVSTAYSLV